MTKTGNIASAQISQQWFVNCFLPHAQWIVWFPACVAGLDKPQQHPMMQHSTAGWHHGLQHNISQSKWFNIPIYLSRHKEREKQIEQGDSFSTFLTPAEWTLLLGVWLDGPIKLIIIGWVSADKGWITQELTPQYSQPAVILLAYKKLRCGRALFARTWSPIIPISPRFRRWEPTLAGRGSEVERGGGKGMLEGK